MTRKRAAGRAQVQRPASQYPEQRLAPMHPDSERETAREPSGFVACVGNAAKTDGTCPVCEKPKLDVTRRTTGGHWVSCWSCEANGLIGREYLTALLDAIDAQPNQGGQLLDEGPAFTPLRPWLEGRAASGRRQVTLPSHGSVHGWASALFASGEPLTYLVERRRLSPEILRRFLVGWDMRPGRRHVPDPR